MIGLINKASKKAAIKEVKELSKNLRAGKKVTFQEAQSSSTRNQTQKPRKRQNPRVRQPKNGSRSNPNSSSSNSKNQYNNPPKKKKRNLSQSQQTQKPNPTKNRKGKRRKTFKSMKWVCPKSKDHVKNQEESLKEHFVVPIENLRKL